VTKRVVLSAPLMALGALAAIGGGALMAVFSAEQLSELAQGHHREDSRTGP
jgi:hypothetical protein